MHAALVGKLAVEWGDQVTVAAQDRGRGDPEDLRPLPTVRQPGSRRPPEPVGVIPPQPAASHLTAQHLVLETQYQQLNVLGQIRPDPHRQEAEQAPRQPVDQ